MSWLFRIAAKAKGLDITDVLNQQAADEIITLLKELFT